VPLIGEKENEKKIYQVIPIDLRSIGSLMLSWKTRNTMTASVPGVYTNEKSLEK
jgi:hypothetical protein